MKLPACRPRTCDNFPDLLWSILNHHHGPHLSQKLWKEKKRKKKKRRSLWTPTQLKTTLGCGARKVHNHRTHPLASCLPADIRPVA
eukprot:1648950-Amphidinium_carterae.1